MIIHYSVYKSQLKYVSEFKKNHEFFFCALTRLRSGRISNETNITSERRMTLNGSQMLRTNKIHCRFCFHRTLRRVLLTLGPSIQTSRGYYNLYKPFNNCYMKFPRIQLDSLPTYLFSKTFGSPKLLSYSPMKRLVSKRTVRAETKQGIGLLFFWAEWRWCKRVSLGC